MVQVHTLKEKDGHIRSLQQANKALQQDKDGLQRDLHQTKEDLKKAKEEVRSLTALCNILKVCIANPNLMFQIWIIAYWKNRNMNSHYIAVVYIFQFLDCCSVFFHGEFVFPDKHGITRYQWARIEKQLWLLYDIPNRKLQF